jgi:predicted nucleotidyltransferase
MRASEPSSHWNDLSHPSPGGLPAPDGQVQAYLADVVRIGEASEGLVCSIVLFGSAATGSYSRAVSDVDLLFVVRDGAGDEDQDRLCDAITELEAGHGLGKRIRQGRLERFADRITANERTFFVGSRADLLSGDPARILGLTRVQASLVDRVAIPSIVASGVVLWGEDLLAAVPLPAIRRVDVLKSFFGLFSQALFSAATYALLPHATRYAMDALKRSVHNCYFCYERRAAPLEEEVRYLDRVQGPSGARARLLHLRSQYAPSFGFVLTTLTAIILQHAITAWGISYPRQLPSSEAHASSHRPGLTEN